MKAAVIHESSFGNTRRVAEAVAEGLRSSGAEIAVAGVDEPPPAVEELDLVVVGAPTHVHGMSSSRSRRGAIDQGAQADSPGRGVRGWLEELPEGEGCHAAAFDTRIDKPVLLVGSAARGIAKRLRRRGYELAAPPESFFVTDSEGPLADGELERAKAWGGALATALPAEASISQ